MRICFSKLRNKSMFLIDLYGLQYINEFREQVKTKLLENGICQSEELEIGDIMCSRKQMVLCMGGG